MNSSAKNLPLPGVRTHDTERAALTPSETARRLGLCRATIYRHIASGKLRTFKIGRSRRVSTDALRDFIVALEDEAHGS